MELDRVLNALRRWWWLLFLGTVLATLSGFIVTRLQAPVYEAKASVMVGRSIESPNPSSNDLFLSQQLAQTYVEIAMRRPVQDAASAALGLNDLPPYEVALVPNTQLLEIKVQDIDPVRAQAVANELANQLIKLSPNEQGEQTRERRQFLTQEVAQLEQNINDTRAHMQELTNKLASMFSAREIADAQNQLSALDQKLTAYQGNYAALLTILEGGANSLEVVEPAVLPVKPVNENLVRNMLAIAALGLALTLLAVFVLEYLDDTLKSPDDVKRVLHVPTLGTNVQLNPDRSGATRVVSTTPDSPVIEAYQLLATNIQSSSNASIKTLLIASSREGEGKTVTVANLGIAMAYQGFRVVMVDTDLRRPSLHEQFDLPNSMGLTSAMLKENPEVASYLRETGLEGLRLLPAGPIPHNPLGLLNSERFAHLLAELKQMADIVILDSPPVLAVADAPLLAKQVDGVVLVVDARDTRRAWATRAYDMLEQVGANIIGVALNRLAPEKGMTYGYYASSGQGPGGSDPQQPPRKRRLLPGTDPRT